MTNVELKNTQPSAPPQGDKVANYLTMVGHWCTDINQGALAAILPFLVTGYGYTYTQAALLVFAANIASAIIQPLFGWLGDKRPTPRLMALGTFMAGAGMAGVGYAGSFELVLASALMCGTGIAMFHPEGGRLANLAAGARKGNGMSIFAVGGNLGMFTGPVMVAVFVSAWGLAGTWVFLVPTTICAVVLLVQNQRFVALGAQATKTRQAAAEKRPEQWGMFWLILSVLSVRSIVHYGLMAFIPLFFVSALGQTEAASSMLISLFSVAAALATFLSGRTAERVGANRLLVACMIFLTVGVVAFAFNSVLWVSVVLTIVLAIALDLFYPSTVAVAMGCVPEHLGIASGMCYGVAICMGGAAEPFFGIAGDAFGLQPVMLLLAAVALVGVVLSLVVHSRATKPSKFTQAKPREG